MSSSQYAACLQLAGDTLFFSSCKTEGGWPETEPELEQEELSAKGVDFVQMRDVSWIYLPWRMRVMADFATWPAGVAARATWRRSAKAFATLTKYARGQSYNIGRVRIRQVLDLDLQPGQAVGFGSVPGSSAILTATFECVCVR